MPAGSLANAALVGANTVKGPSAERASARPAALIAATSVEKSGLPAAMATMVSPPDALGMGMAADLWQEGAGSSFAKVQQTGAASRAATGVSAKTAENFMGRFLSREFDVDSRATPDLSETVSEVAAGPIQRLGAKRWHTVKVHSRE